MPETVSRYEGDPVSEQPAEMYFPAAYSASQIGAAPGALSPTFGASDTEVASPYGSTASSPSDSDPHAPTAGETVQPQGSRNEPPRLIEPTPFSRPEPQNQHSEAAQAVAAYGLSQAALEDLSASVTAPVPGDAGEPPFFAERELAPQEAAGFDQLIAGGPAESRGPLDSAPGAGETMSTQEPLSDSQPSAPAWGIDGAQGDTENSTDDVTDADAGADGNTDAEAELQQVYPPRQPGYFSLETAGLEPTPLQYRLGRSTRLFWTWFGVNSSALSFAVGALLLTFGLSLRQAMIAALVGSALSALPLALGTMAGKWSGQPTLVISRATFGLFGNVLPASLALIARVFWTVVLLWLFGTSLLSVFRVAGIEIPFDDLQFGLMIMGVGFIIAALVATMGFHLIIRLQFVFTLISLAMVSGLIGFTWGEVDFAAALGTPDGSWLGAVSAAVLVFSLIGLAFSNSTSDVARYQHPASSRAAGMTWATLGSVLPTFVLVGYGALLAASNPVLARGLLSDPVATLAELLPGWYPVPLMLALGVSLLFGAIISLYSGGFAVQAIGISNTRWLAVLIAAVLSGAALIFVVLNPYHQLEFAGLLSAHALLLAVPISAWTGIFVVDMMLRTRRFERKDLLRPGGIYPAVRWGNIAALVLLSVFGYGVMVLDVPWLSWLGYLVAPFEAVGISLPAELYEGGAAVVLVLFLGMLVGLLTGISSVRKQENTRPVRAGSGWSPE